MTKKEKYQAARAHVEKAIKEAQDMVREVFDEQVHEEVFSKHPELQAFKWNQYTPYFNDGDECEFGVHRDAGCIDVRGVGDEGWVEDSDQVSTCRDWRIKGYPTIPEDQRHRLHAAQAAAAKFLRQFDEDDLKHMFDDHVEITCDRDTGVSVDEYSHE